MLINIAEPERHLVTDYDITLDNSFLLSITVDETKGDRIDLGKDTLNIFLSAKPSKLNPKDTLPEEDITVFREHIVVINKKMREVADVTPEQQSSWLDTLKTSGSTVQ